MKNKNTRYWLGVCFAILTVTGCDSQPDRATKFEGSKYQLFIKASTGEKWLIQHRFGDNYVLYKCTEIMPESVCN